MGSCVTYIIKTYPVPNSTVAMEKPASIALRRAQIALKAGDNHTARRFAQKAAELSPDHEEPWLLMAALASPKASIAYLNKALEINPNSNRARGGMHWAITRYRLTSQQPSPSRGVVSSSIQKNAFINQKPVFLPWIIIVMLASFGAFLWFSKPTITLAFSPLNVVEISQGNINKSTLTPIPTNTPTPTSTFTPTLTPTNTPTPTDTPLPTSTIKPTITEQKKQSLVDLPSVVNPGERWIDVDLTNQRVRAYQGKNLINSFVTSTGTWQHPTVTGQYRIYVKYRYADMAGPGYYLPNVPYVMYFYKGYGIHGTYWHNNFGTPMSHGCVNLRTEDSGWVYNWASVGTIVNIHY